MSHGHTEWAAAAYMCQGKCQAVQWAVLPSAPTHPCHVTQAADSQALENLPQAFSGHSQPHARQMRVQGPRAHPLPPATLSSEVQGVKTPASCLAHSVAAH